MSEPVYIARKATDIDALLGKADTAVQPAAIAGLVTTSDSRLSNERAPTTHAASHAIAGGDAITPAAIGAATSAQGALADTAVQPAALSGYVATDDARLSDARTPLAHDQAASTITGLATVATSGSYADLSNKPTIPSTPGEVGAAAVSHTQDANTITGLAAVATSGGYSDLSGTPTIPTLPAQASEAELLAGTETAPRLNSPADLVTAIEAHAPAGATTFAALTDVDVITTPPTEGQAPLWDATEEKWIPGTVAAEGGTGDVIGPASSIDNSIPLFDGIEGKTLQGSGLRYNDNNSFSLDVAGQTAGNARGIGAFDFQANRNAADHVASGTYATAFGYRCKASGDYGSFAGGYEADATGYASVAHGQSCVSSGNNSFTAGYSSTASGNNSFAFGHASIASVNWAVALGSTARADKKAQFAFGVSSDFTGNYQWSVLGLNGTTTNDTPTVLATPDPATVPANKTWDFHGRVVARSAGGADHASWEINGLIARDGANNTALIGTPTVTALFASAGASAWAIAVSANDTTEALVLTVTGAAATTIRWNARLDLVEVLHG